MLDSKPKIIGLELNYKYSEQVSSNYNFNKYPPSNTNQLQSMTATSGTYTKFFIMLSNSVFNLFRKFQFYCYNSSNKNFILKQMILKLLLLIQQLLLILEFY